MGALALPGLLGCHGEDAPTDQLGYCFSGSSASPHAGGGES